jgi:hypothetical protein
VLAELCHSRHIAGKLNECLAAMARTGNCNTPARPATTGNLPQVSVELAEFSMKLIPRWAKDGLRVLRLRNSLDT